MTTLPISNLQTTSAAKTALQIGSGALLLAIASQILVPLPFTPIPLSLGTLAAMLLGAALGPAKGAASVGLYVVAGVVGVPVFAGFKAGIMAASFGYAIGYLAAAFLVGIYAVRTTKPSIFASFGAAVAASAAILTMGTTWLTAVTGISLSAGIAAGVVPFLIGDSLKSIVVAAALYGVRARRSRW